MHVTDSNSKSLIKARRLSPAASIDSMNSRTCKDVFSCVLNISDNSETPQTGNDLGDVIDSNNEIHCPSAATTTIPLAAPEAQESCPPKRTAGVSGRELSPSVFRCKRTVSTKPQWHHQQHQQASNISQLHILQLHAQIAALRRLAGCNSDPAAGITNEAQRHQQQLRLAPPALITAPDQTQTPAHTPAACGSPLPTTSIQDVMAIATNSKKGVAAAEDVTTAAAAELLQTDVAADSPCAALAARVQALVFENAALRQTLAGIALAAGLQRHQMQQQRMQQIVEQQEELEMRRVRHEMLVGVAGCGKEIGGWLAEVRKLMDRGECWGQGQGWCAGGLDAAGDAMDDVGTGEDHGKGYEECKDGDENQDADEYADEYADEDDERVVADVAGGL
ncbi:hypothetical protein HDU83_005523 [Entophlyctis luteolus]|nr:hypothetical protein HDU83_005523 [Entophlyctis luteolus]KAJ3378848.1 hypothetical protein HDU84_007243 [Entophlyctis sp. JEL0112]